MHSAALRQQEVQEAGRRRQKVCRLCLIVTHSGLECLADVC